ncbi:MAG: ribosome silencing factor [Desulfuromonadaceae bacterium]|nr:ribosome silencing factor [Desulfuromonadaceae bacterium]
MNSDTLAQLCAKSALDKKALDLRILHIAELSSLTDYLVIATGTSDRHVQAIAESIREDLKQQHDDTPLAVEGMTEGRWVLLDYGDVMVHVFQTEVRNFYDLEGLWVEAADLELAEAIIP